LFHNRIAGMPKCILLVEDEENSIAALTDVLELVLGQEVLVARNGVEAVQMAHAHRPDLILMDLDLPKLDGIEATRSLKSSDEFRHTPILAVTAHSMVGDRERALAAGCDDYFPKPIDVEAFIAFLQPYLGDDEGEERQ
jgi:two-component system cell cycle response regulator DivK